VFFLAVMALRRLALRGAVLDVAILALAFGAALLTRYSALQLVPILIGSRCGVLTGKSGARRCCCGDCRRVPGGVVLLDAGYLFQMTMLRWDIAGSSPGHEGAGAPAAVARLPLPDAYIAGLDYLREITESVKPIFVLGGRARTRVVVFPAAAAVNGPLGLLGLVALAAGARPAPPRELG